MTKKLDFDFICHLAKDVMEKQGSHSPQLIWVEPDGRCSMAVVPFGNDEDKEIICRMFRQKFQHDRICRYWFMTEAWVGHNLSIRPSKDSERTEALICMEFNKGDKTKSVQFSFTRQDGRIVWGKRTDLSKYESRSRWDFFREDVMDEVIEKARRQKK